MSYFYAGAMGGTDTTDATATSSDILLSKTAYANGVKIEGNIQSIGPATYTPTTTSQMIPYGKYIFGPIEIKGDSNLVGSNIKQGVSIFGVSGNYQGTDTSDTTATASDVLSSKYFYNNSGVRTQGTMTQRSQSSETITSAKTYYAGFYPNNFTITPNSGTDTSDATVSSNSQILSNFIAYSKGTKYTGSMANKGSVSSTLNPNSSYSGSAGYYSSINISANPNTGTTVLSSVLTNAKLATGDTLYDMGVSNTVRYLNTIGFGNAMRMIHTSNLNDNGVVANASSGYADSQNWKKVITIPTATSLKVYYAYATQSGYDYCSIWSGTVTSSSITAKSPGTTNVLLSAANGGTSSTSNPLPKEKGQLTVTGNTITVGFYSDSGGHYYYGFYVLAIDAAIANYINIGGGATLTGNAVPSQVLKDYTFYSNDSNTKQSGTMTNRGAISTSINPGGSYTIPQGYHNGNGYVYANQPSYSGNAVPSQVLSGKKFYSTNSTLQTGTMSINSSIPSNITLEPGQIQYIPPGYISDTWITASSYLLKLNFTYEMLWENTNTSASFSAQNITINRIIDYYGGADAFYLLVIRWLTAVSGTGYYKAMYLDASKGSLSLGKWSISGNTSNTIHRNFDFSFNTATNKTTIAFGNARSSGSTDNSLCIPGDIQLLKVQPITQ